MKKSYNLKSKFFSLVASALLAIVPLQVNAAITLFEKNELQIVITPDGFPIIWMDADQYKLDFTYDANQVDYCATAQTVCDQLTTDYSVTEPFASYRIYNIDQYISYTVFYDATGKIVGFAKEDNTPPGPPAEEVIPSWSTSNSVGTLSGDFSVSATGSAVYSVGIDVPPGTAGIEPSLGLTYDSQSGDSGLGSSWSLGGLSTISRCPKTKAQDNSVVGGINFTVTDRLCLDGARLMLPTGYTIDDVAYWAATEYRLEQSSKVKIVRHGSGFRVLAKGGRFSEYGTTDDSIQNVEIINTGATPVISWAINKSQDQASNYLTYSYFEDISNGGHLISRIDYTGNTNKSLAPYASVRFKYASRPDRQYGYMGGARLNNLNRLTNIQTYVGNSQVKDYRLFYEAEPVTKMSRIKALSVCNAVTQCVQPTLFGWTDDTVTQLEDVKSISNGVSFDVDTEVHNIQIIDMNGDGLDDWVATISGLVESVIYVRLATSSGGFGAPILSNAGSLSNKFNLADVNGDGFPDWTSFISQSATKVGLSNGDGTFKAAVTSSNGNNYGLETLKFVDINGDGLSDWVSAYDVNTHVRFSQGNGYFDDVVSSGNDGSFLTGSISFADMNGDGLADWISLAADKTSIRLSKGDGHFGPLMETTNGKTYDLTTLKLADINGDGLVDWVSATTNMTHVRFSKGDGTFESVISSLNNSKGGDIRFTDINNDGLADWISANVVVYDTPSALAEIYVRLSKGDGFFGDAFIPVTSNNQPLIFTNLYAGLNGSSIKLADINGDGLLDWLSISDLETQVSLSTGQEANLVTSIMDGFNNETAITYASVADTSIHQQQLTDALCIPGENICTVYPHNVVSSRTTTDGLNGTINTQYTYGGLKTNLQGRGQLGFAWTESNNTTTGLKSKVNYYQNYPYIGMVDSETQILDGKTLGYTKNTPAIYPIGTDREMPYLKTKLVDSYSSAGVKLNTVTTDNFINNPNGDITTVVVTAQDANNPVEKYSTITNNTYQYYYYSDFNLTSLLTGVNVYKTGPNGTSNRTETNYAYDLQTYRLKSERTIVVEAGLGHSGINKAYAYTDGFGHINETTITAGDIETRVVSTAYDAKGQFAISMINEMGHESKATYDSAFGVPLTKTDVNGLVTTYYYNKWGEVTDVYAPGGNKTHTVKNWLPNNYTIPAINVSLSPQLALFSSTTSVAGGTSSNEKYAPDVTTYYDKQGRAIRTQTTNFKGETLLVDTAYDYLGRVVAQTQPYFVNDTKHETITVYDKLSRVVEVHSPDEGVARTSYNEADYSAETVVTAYNSTNSTNPAASGTFTHRSSEKKNIIGQVIYNTDNDGNKLYYEYDVHGNKTKTLMPSVDGAGNIIDPKGTVVSIEYDVFGRKKAMIDPNMGRWTYTYDSTSKLRSQTDANGQITTMTYDRLGRMTQRVDDDGTVTRWVYNDDLIALDTPNTMAIGKLDAVYQTVTGAYEVYRQTYQYSADLGLPVSSLTTIEEAEVTNSQKVSYESLTSYDRFHRPETVSYPETSANKRLVLKYVYTNGALTQVNNAETNYRYWQIDSVDAKGQSILAQYGIDPSQGVTGVVEQAYAYDAAGRVTWFDYSDSLNSTLYHSEYDYNELGTLVYRKSLRANSINYLEERYSYDSLQRLISVESDGTANARQFTYDVLGNIRTKNVLGNDLSSYEYTNGKPHAVSRANNVNYLYNNNGGLTSGAGRTVTWSAFNKPLKISNSGGYSSFKYGPGRGRYKQTSLQYAAGGNPEKQLTTIYVGGSYEKVSKNGITSHKHYIKVGGETIAQYTVEQADSNDIGTDTLEFLLRDKQGSIVTIVNSSGGVTAEMDYDAFGGRRPIFKSTLITSAIVAKPRGYTGHEHLDQLGLIHMNGRVYDPELGRFLSADPIIQFSKNIQSYNRYSYVLNNPMSYTDPSGFSIKRAFNTLARISGAIITGGNSEIFRNKRVKRMFLKHSWARIGLQVGASFGGPFAAAAAAAYLTDISGGSLSDAVQSGIMSLMSSYMMSTLPKVPSGANFFTWKSAVIMLAHGTVRGVSSGFAGGAFKGGFITGALTAGVALSGLNEGIDGLDKAFNMLAAAAVGGTISRLSGGNFGHGAGAALFGRMLGEMAQSSSQSSGCNSKNPINIATGEKYLTMLDYQSKGASKLKFERYYSSYSKAKTGLGEGWRSNFDKALSFEGNVNGQPWTVSYTKINRERVTFTKDKEGNWVALDNEQETLQKTSQGWQLTNARDEVETFNEQGRLLSIQHRGGYQQQLTYNAKDQLVKVSDTFGASVQLAYNRHGLLKAMTDPQGNTTHYRYDMSRQLLTKVIYPDSTEILEDNPYKQYHYNDARFTHSITGITNELGQRIHSMAYDDTGRAILSELGDHAERVDITFNHNRSSTVRNSLGRETTYHFDKDDHATSIEGHATASCVASNQGYTYDERGNIESKTDWNGVVTTYTFNNRNLEVTRTEAQGTDVERTIETTWHANFRLPTRIVKPGLTTEFVYNEQGLLIEQTEFDILVENRGERSWLEELFNHYPSRTTTYAYNAQGLLTQVDGPRTDVNDISHYRYDAKGNRIEVRNALNHTSKIKSLDNNGNPLVIVDANGVETQLSYNARGWLQSKTVKLNDGDVTTQYHYAHSGNYKGEGQVSKVTLPNKQQVSYEYDKAYRVIGISNSQGERISYTLDLEGNRIAETTHNSQGELVRTQQQVFDELSRLLAHIGANKQTTAYHYNKNGQLASVIDPMKNETHQAFDALNRLIATTDANEGVIKKAYDQQGRVSTISDQRNLTTEYRYNGFGDKIAQISPDTGITVYAYNEAGQLVNKTDARGVETHYHYDVLGRVTDILYPASSADDIHYAYDEQNTKGKNSIGRLAKVSDPSGNTEYAYNPQGKVQVKEYRIGDTHYRIENKYNANGGLTSTTYPSGRVVSYQFNQLGQMSGVTTQASVNAQKQSVINQASYLPFGPLSHIRYGNNTETVIERDKDYRISSIRLNDNNIVDTLYGVNYDYDAASNITQISDQLNQQQSQQFVYDDLYRLVAADGSYGRVEYDYDKVGNRLQRRLMSADSANAMVEDYDYAHDSNRLLSVALHNSGDDSANTTERLLSYDAVGNIVSDQKSAENNTALIYGANNRLQGIDKNVTGASYLYNAKGQRVSKTVKQTDGSLEVTHFHYNGANQLMAETNELGEAVREYLYMGRERVAKVEYQNDIMGELVFIHNDHLGAPQLMTDELRRVVWTANALPFGQSVVAVDDERQKLKFPGQYFDGETGYAYNYFRDYDASLGRYIQSDPIGLAGGVNSFGYVKGNPVDFIDPLGLASIGLRPLDGSKSTVAYSSFSKWLGTGNLGFYHAQIFFGDGGIPRNIGKTSGGGWFYGKTKPLIETDPAVLSNYTMIESGLDDSIMRTAVKNVDMGGSYCLIGYNCQVYVAKVKAEYNELTRKKYGKSCGRVIE